MQEPEVQAHVFLIETERISSNPYQPRKVFDEEGIRELASSIREFGILQPLVVTKIEEDGEQGTHVSYQLIAGERRLLAARMIGLERVPAIVKNVGLDRERLEMAIVENVQRANLNPIESAKAYNRLQDEFGLTQREIAARIGKSRESIANTMRLLNLPTEMQDALNKGIISESQARLLLSVEDMAQQQVFFNELLKNNLSVRDLRARIEQYKISQRKNELKQHALGHDPELASLERELEEFLGTKVKMEREGPSGKITISFYSPEELHEIIQKLIAKERSALGGAEPALIVEHNSAVQIDPQLLPEQENSSPRDLPSSDAPSAAPEFHL